jgi:hypothetical protein
MANAARFWRKSKKKEKSFSVQQSGITKSGLREKKKSLKKVKKVKKKYATTHYHFFRRE